MVILVVIIVWANTTVALVSYLTLMFGAGFLAYFLSAYYNRVFEPYLPKEDEDCDQTEKLSMQSNGEES